MPWNTFVRVKNRANGKELSVPLIDLGPALSAPSHAAIDLTETAFALLGGAPADGVMRVDFVIPGGALFLRRAPVSSRSLARAEKANGSAIHAAACMAAHGTFDGVPKPPIKKFYSSPNRSSRNGTTIDMIVLHFTDGPSAESAINHFMDQTSQVSAHYIIDKNGDIYQMVEDSERAYHAKSANARSIGIEHVARAGERMTPEQEESSVALIRWLMSAYDVTPDGITGHRFAPGNAGTTDCPDHLFGNANKAAIDAWVAANFGPPVVADAGRVAEHERM
jgi:hypothetical protein